MALLTYPKFQTSDINGVNLAGGLVYFYETGTTTPKTTYSDSALSSANANPVVLNARGEADIYLSLTAYKIVLHDADDVEIWTEDNYTEHTSAGEWVSELAGTYVSSTSFTLIGDQTADYHLSRRVRSVGSTTLYGTIVTSAFTTLTTITVVWDSGTLSNEALTVSIGLSSDNHSFPNVIAFRESLSKGVDVASASALTLGTDGNYFDITGTTAITSISAISVGTVVKLHFDGILTLTHHATDLILPSGANITTAAGDEAEFIEYATGDWRCLNYTKANGQSVNPIFSESFASAEQTITAAGSLTVAHSLSAKPELLQFRLICKTAEANYSIDDELIVNNLTNNAGSGGANRGFACTVDATNINIRYADNASTFSVFNKTTGAGTQITNANWKFIIRAWV